MYLLRCPYSLECLEGVRLLKKSLSARPAIQKRLETRRKHYRNGLFSPETGSREEREGVFQQAEVLSEVRGYNPRPFALP